MAKTRHIDVLYRGVDIWNSWREQNPNEKPNLRKANLVGRNLTYMNLSNTNLSEADLSHSNLSHAKLNGANLSGATLAWTILGNNDLSEVNGLEKVQTYGPSTIGIDTLYKSSGKIPESFLRKCGVPDSFIAFLASLIGAEQAMQFYSCFISYSHRDEDFAKRLYSRMRDENLRVWYAPENIKGGEKLHEQIYQAIQIHDKLLLVLSENSLQSEWVITEIRKARKTEVEEKRRKLFPIRLVSMDKIQTWECFDADTGKDLAIEVREYFIPDFSNWKEHDDFEAAFNRLLRDLRAAEYRK